MCGFAGFVDLERKFSVEQRLHIARAMAALLSHRGPDDNGAWSEPGAGIAVAFRRLAIIDLSAHGHQPMVSSCGRSVLVFNGEVYNASELARDLQSAGHRFRGHSDTEVLLECLEAFGLEATLKRLIGMYAIAWYQPSSRKLVLIRDRLGKKPLYFGRVGKMLFFGSQTKSFSAHPAWQPDIDRDALALFMRYGYLPAPHSIYRGINVLRPGEYVVFVDGELKEQRRYWDIRDIARKGQSAPLSLHDDEAKRQLAHHLADAVKLRLVSDVSLGAFLSGGIDSSTIVAFMQKASASPVKTFSIGFEETAYDESAHAARVARHLGTEHHELRVTPADALALIPKLPEYYDEPFADSSQIPTFLLCQLTRRHVTVALSGDGGDELFAGYARYELAGEIINKIQRLPVPMRSALAQTLKHTPALLWRAIEPVVSARFGRSPLTQRVRKLADLMGHGAIERLYQGLVGQWPEPARLVIGAAPLRRPDLAWGFGARQSGAPAPAAAHRHAHVFARRYSREGGSRQHGRGARSPRAAARSSSG